MLQNVTCGGNIGLMAVLLKEHPLQCHRPSDPALGQVFALLGEIPKDGVRLRETCAILQLQDRYPPVGILSKELGRATRAVQDIHFHQLIRALELCKQKADLVSISGLKAIVKPHRLPSSVPLITGYGTCVAMTTSTSSLDMAPRTAEAMSPDASADAASRRIVIVRR